MSLNSIYIYSGCIHIYICITILKMHLYTHKALLSSCMDEPHDVRGSWCCAKHRAASRRKAPPSKSKNELCGSVMIKCIKKKKRSTEVYSGGTPPSGLPLPSGRQHPPARPSWNVLQQAMHALPRMPLPIYKILIFEENFNKLKNESTPTNMCAHVSYAYAHMLPLTCSTHPLPAPTHAPGTGTQ